MLIYQIDKKKGSFIEEGKEKGKKQA